MSDQIPNPPAFPRPDMIVEGHVGGGSDGMTLRDYFAAKAMAAALSEVGVDTALTSDEELAAASYQLADAMLKERAK